MTNFQKIEQKWQKKWEDSEIFKVKEDSKKKKYYVLEMFPYPSASGLHMGHALNYTIGDIFARFKRMQNYNVLYPMGYDAFGLPAENAAIKAKQHPKVYTEASMKNFEKQQKSLGLSYDWSRIVKTCESEYYKWNQYFFLKFFENGLVYRKKSPVNWCPKCDTVLANEQVHNGRCWRHEDTEVEIKHLEQWFIKTTKYSEELLKDIEKLEWPERIKLMQQNWIGKSYGTEINFEINGENWPIFTTRVDTIFSVTFMVVSAQHPKLNSLITEKQKKEVNNFLKKIKSVSEKELEALEKEGVFTGSYAINPFTGEKVPVWIGNFVLADYGSGMVMADGHDVRDVEFAKKYNIPLKTVIKPIERKTNPNEVFTEKGILYNSGEFSGLSSDEAIIKMQNWLENRKLGKKTLQYKFKDWLVSRQRYWGTPIPIIYCNKCGLVPEKNLPVLLPEKVEFGKGNPLATNKNFVNVKCPKCNSDAKRETDTMDTFFDSSWYYLRYCDNKNLKEAFEKKKADYWLPVDQYIGGAEHACMHLIYARFFVKALRDLGLLKIDEPFTRLFNQGMLHGADGNKMSKSLGNVIVPEEVSKVYGIDTARLFLVSVASPDKDIEWSENGIQGMFRFTNRLVDYFENVKISKAKNEKLESASNKAIKEITEDIESFKYNIATIKLRQLFEKISKEEVNKETLENFLKLLSPFAPHLAEELWEKIGNKGFISVSEWPKYDSKKIKIEFEYEDEFMENIKSDINTVIKLVGKQPKIIKMFVSESWKYEVYRKLAKLESRNIKEVIEKIMVKGYEKEIPKIAQSFIKNPNAFMKIVLDQKTEMKILEENKKELESMFNSKIEIIKAESSKEVKAKQAVPGKVAILIE
ncbi:MAG: leucine--tRNA ligase [Candidatus Nanoarchaeia archaeon]|nr:leucine--tRNA ligase [Candidatus Nanoarchaeia archaeon]